MTLRSVTICELKREYLACSYLELPCRTERRTDRQGPKPNAAIDDRRTMYRRSDSVPLIASNGFERSTKHRHVIDHTSVERGK